MDDCTVALRLLDPTGAYETKLALRLLVRRATAHCWEGAFEHGRVDFKRALLLDSNNKSLRDDVEMLVTTTGLHPGPQLLSVTTPLSYPLTSASRFPPMSRWARPCQGSCQGSGRARRRVRC